MKKAELKSFLEFKYSQFSNPSFLPPDPVSIPHLFSVKEDIEIAGFLTSVISWGNRKSILTNARRLMELTDMSPHSFITSFETSDLKPFESFVHRTFNGSDCIFFLHSLQNIYKNEGGLESCFVSKGGTGIKPRISAFRKKFFGLPHLPRHEKHIADPEKGASCKRLNMFLRWMVRDGTGGVDFGIWKSIPASELICPLDIHTGNIARKLGLLKRTINDWNAAEELTASLRRFDPQDPVKYDLALFGMGSSGDF